MNGQPTNKRRIATIVLNYNNYKDTAECVDGILDDDSLDVIIVDNDSPDGSGERLRRAYSDRQNVTYIESGMNRGYAAGNNVGIRYALSNLDDEYLCILNNDTLPEPEMFDRLAEHLESNPSCGIVGPVILENKPGFEIQSAGANIDLWHGDASPWHSGEQYRPSEKATSVPYVSGACMMVRSRDIDKLGFIPECYFLFFEETEWCLRAARQGIGVACLWNTSLIHKGSASVSKRGSLSSYLMVRNKALFEKRNASRPQLLFFKLYIVILTYVRHYLKGRDCIWEIAALRDGFNNRFCTEYSFLGGDRAE